MSAVADATLTPLLGQHEVLTGKGMTVLANRLVGVLVAVSPTFNRILHVVLLSALVQVIGTNASRDVAVVADLLCAVERTIDLLKQPTVGIDPPFAYTEKSIPFGLSASP